MRKNIVDKEPGKASTFGEFSVEGRVPGNRGFTLIEMMIALFVGALLILISYNVLVTQKRASESQNQFVNAQQNARVALETMERELRLAGLNIDDFNNQPIFIDAAPYQVIFNADISSGVSGVPSMTIYQQVPLHDGTMYSPGMYPDEKLGSLERYNNNAETIRYTLDRNDDGIVDANDRYTETQNPSDYALYREENGTRKDIVAYGIRGRENYPDGQFPQPLFKYYGDFNGNGTITLWGDTDGDGQLSQTELAVLTAVPQPLLNKIVEVEITVEAESAMMEAGYTGPHSLPSNKRHYRNVVMTSKVRPRNVGTGNANLHACGNPPASPTGLTAFDAPEDDGSSITLTFYGSFDELNGENDVFNYTVYRRAEDENEWTCIGSVTPNGSTSYTFNDDRSTPAGGPEMGVGYYYMVTAWDCRPQESNPSNVTGPVQALANGPAPPAITYAWDTPCDDRDEITVRIQRSADDQVNGGNVLYYQIYRGMSQGGGYLSKTLIGKFMADGSDYYTFYDNEDNNLALAPPASGHYYYYIAKAFSTDSIPSIDSNEWGGVYYSGTISACYLAGVDDYPDDDGEALIIRWDKSPSEDCMPSQVVGYEIMRKSINEPEYQLIQYIPATHSSVYSYIDDGLIRGNLYTYKIMTTNGTISVPSNEKSAIPVSNTSIDPPQNLTADDILCDASGAISISWERSPQDVPIGGVITHYNIYRRQEFTEAVKVGEVEADGSDTYTFIDGPETNPTSPPIIGEFYYYFATAYDDDKSRESAPSNEDYTMSDGEPGAPYITDAYDTPMDAGKSITVVFNRSADDGHCSENVIVYRIYRETEEDGGTGGFDHLVGEITATGSPSYTFYDDDLFSYDPPVDGIAYYYAVRAFDGDKESVNSNIVGPVYSISQDPSSYIVFQDDFETDKGWVHGYTRTQDDWQRGIPNGNGGLYYGNHDPSSAHSGSCVYGNDLGPDGWNGDYKNNTDNYLVTPAGAIDCYGRNNVVIQFYRWLNVEGPAYDQASIYISTNGHDGPWTLIWQNESEITDNEWVFMEIDISDYADGQSDVAIMFRLKSDGAHAYAGWNIDDFVVREKPVLP